MDCHTFIYINMKRMICSRWDGTSKEKGSIVVRLVFGQEVLVGMTAFGN